MKKAASAEIEFSSDKPEAHAWQSFFTLLFDLLDELDAVRQRGCDCQRQKDQIAPVSETQA